MTRIIYFKETVVHAFHFRDFHLSKDAFPFSKSEVVYGTIALLIFVMSFAIVIDKLF